MMSVFFGVFFFVCVCVCVCVTQHNTKLKALKYAQNASTANIHKKPFCNSPAAKTTSTLHQRNHNPSPLLTAMSYPHNPLGFTFMWWGRCGLCLWHKSTELVHSFLFCSCICLCLYGLFNCISFHKFSRQLSAFSLCSPGLTSALLVLSTILYLFVKVSLIPDIILCDLLGLKHQLTN